MFNLRALSPFFVVLGLVGAAAVPAGSASNLLTETFRGTNLTVPAEWNAGGTSFTPCLTAGTNTTQTPVPGCETTAIDAAGSGTLRLTPAVNNRAGYTLYNRAITTAGGLDITFNQAQYGGNGADGIAFFLVDGATDLTAPGGLGGSLGYAPNASTPGVTNGLLGVGIDAHGNFSGTATDGTGCTAAPGQAANRITLRGPGSGLAGYCYLAQSGALTLRDAGSTRVARSVRIVIDDASVASRMVKVYYDGSTSPVVETAAPTALLAASTFKFGFASGTGGLNDIHEVWGLTVNSVVPITVRDGDGYWLGGAEGGVFAFGGAGFHGSNPSQYPAAAFVGLAPTETGAGYWLATSDGTVFEHGDAADINVGAAISLNQPIVGIASTPSDDGYWLAARDGGVFTAGDADFLGSMGGARLNKPIVGIASTPSGDGYWLVAGDGGIFSFGDAVFFGSTGALTLNQPIVGMAATSLGDGYWLVASDGGVFAFGAAGFHGSMGASRLNAPVVGILSSATDDGYWMAARDGGIFSFGDAVFFGSAGSLTLAGPIVTIAGP